jgi:hypothetical protein
MKKTYSRLVFDFPIRKLHARRAIDSNDFQVKVGLAWMSQVNYEGSLDLLVMPSTYKVVVPSTAMPFASSTPTRTLHSYVSLSTTLKIPRSLELPNHWVIDADCHDFHFCCSRNLFTSYSPLDDLCTNGVPKSGVTVVGYGTIHLPLGKGRTLILRNVFHTPQWKENNISTFQLKLEDFSALRAYLGEFTAESATLPY